MSAGMNKMFPQWWPYEQAWRKRKKGASIKANRRRMVYERDGGCCVTCGTTEDLTLDHIVPRSKGGTNAVDNLQTMCRSCNTEKGNS